MTDPVDTDALRRLSAWLYDESQNDKSELAADGADEVDSLRDDLTRLRTDRDFMLRTIVCLRAVIENAPHDVGCASPAESLLGVARDPNRPCTCWKAEAL